PLPFCPILPLAAPPLPLLYTLSLHDALPISDERVVYVQPFTRAYALFFCWFGVLVFAVTMFLWLTATALAPAAYGLLGLTSAALDRKSTRLNSSHVKISYTVFSLKKTNLRTS